jgi:2-dehydro-3-deoxyphosphogluconate aldolase/(4S)-4-hydroxy-2-oxoglutarate aldolase
MRILDSLGKIVESGLVAIIRVLNAEQAVLAAEACAEGGVQAIEITFTVPDAHRAIEQLATRFQGVPVLLGAGTVLDSETARIAILSGARFIVSPSFNGNVAKLCHRYQAPYLPGAGTVTEILHAMEEGANIVKVFPGESLGPVFVKATLAAIPHAPLMPTGGVSVENVGDWIRAGCVAVGVGGSLTAGAKTGNYAAITRLAKQFLERIAEARGR